MSRLTWDGRAEPISRDQILRHARGQGNVIFSVQLTTSRIGSNLTRLIHTLLYVMTIHIYIHSPLGGSRRVAQNDSDDRAGLRGYVQFNKYTYIHRKVTQYFSSTFFLRCVPLYFSREGFSHSFFPRRPWSRILCTNDLIVLHPLGIFIFFIFFLVRKIPFAGVELTSQRVRGLRGTSELPGRPAAFNILLFLSKNPSIHPIRAGGGREPSKRL